MIYIFFSSVELTLIWIFVWVITFEPSLEVFLQCKPVPCSAVDCTRMLTCLCVIQVRYDLGGIYFQQGCTDQGAYGKAMEHFRQTRDLLQKVGGSIPNLNISASITHRLWLKWLQMWIRKIFVDILQYNNICYAVILQHDSYAMVL